MGLTKYVKSLMNKKMVVLLNKVETIATKSIKRKIAEYFIITAEYFLLIVNSKVKDQMAKVSS